MVLLRWNDRAFHTPAIGVDIFAGAGWSILSDNSILKNLPLGLKQCLEFCFGKNRIIGSVYQWGGHGGRAVPQYTARHGPESTAENLG
ncbi:hypothetical protein RRG08_036297 [Elysia crispata]|uniref:Uncharacterized protein n=1 Tax=Elysia crispata TaxID=231223 RepID=A0AAE1DMM2_9GAST|nr:hypothetical protein RRG08_036297 [Elysia crispata]